MSNVTTIRDHFALAQEWIGAMLDTPEIAQAAPGGVWTVSAPEGMPMPQIHVSNGMRVRPVQTLNGTVIMHRVPMLVEIVDVATNWSRIDQAYPLCYTALVADGQMRELEGGYVYGAILTDSNQDERPQNDKQYLVRTMLIELTVQTTAEQAGG